MVSRGHGKIGGPVTQGKGLKDLQFRTKRKGDTSLSLSVEDCTRKVHGGEEHGT